jgi:CHAT domain-containing protein
MINPKIRIKGVKKAITASEESSELLSLSACYELGAATRAAVDTHDITLNENDMVEFVFEDNTCWMSAASDIKDIFSIPLHKKRGAEEDAFEIPSAISGNEEHRGLIGDIALTAIKIFSKKNRARLVKEKVLEYAEKLQKQQLDDKSGIYALDALFQLQKYIPQNSEKPLLLLLHGTASSTYSSFDGLKGTPAWDYICKNYSGNILAFQHETLTKSPLQNVLELIKQLPENCKLHLISHSRGGLVGDVLSRFCISDDKNLGFSENEIAYLKKCGRVEDIQYIKSITQSILKKNIQVQKFIRVACPASGTTIASQRLDYFFNIVLNLMGLAVGSVANPVYRAFKDLVSAVIDCKEDMTVLPGLEVMNPESPFLKVLNNPAPNAAIDGQLMVVSGNSQLNLSFKALVVIATKLFFTSKNDLVVNTASMYNGAKRVKPVQCFFDEESNVDHFHYFSNPKTNDAILSALKSVGDSLIPGFSFQKQHFTEEALRNAVLNLEGGQVFKDTVTGKRPILVMLPGIMGSNLSNDGNLIWINYFRFVAGKLSQLEYNAKNNRLVTAPSLIKTSYKDLADHLSGAYDVVTFPFDWRRQLKECAELFNEKIIELMKHGQPIKIVGHSMGGVLVRDFIINHEETWQRLNKSSGFRLLFLGSPLGGSFRIPYVLYGYDEIISKIAKIDLFHTKKELLQIFCNLPGLLSLLPLTTDADNDFANEQTWKNMSQKMGDTEWPIPSKKVLEEFGKYRDETLSKSKRIDWSNAVYIAGRDVATPASYTTVNGKLEFIHTAAGDQSVTWDSGIPAKMIEQNNVYYANVSHGGLSCSSSLFAPISDILSKGTTNLLVKSRPLLRSNELEFVSPPIRDFDLSPQGLENTLLGISDMEVMPIGEMPIKVSVSNGDLRFSKFPVLVGHFKKDAILNAEKAIDKNLKGSLSDLHRLNLYPGDIGTSEVVLLKNNSFKGALIVGLGEQGRLTAFQLTQTIEQGVSKYLVGINNPLSEIEADGQQIGLSALLVGCGYGGLSIENSTRAILKGVQNANQKIKNLRLENPRLINCVEFVEMYEDKALGCLYTLNKISSEQSQALNVKLAERNIKKILGARERLPIENTEEWWTRITVKQNEFEKDGMPIEGMQFNISTGGAREEERNLLTSKNIIDRLLQEISTNNHWSPELAKTIFELLIPNDFKEQFKKQNNINWIVDSYTAAYPWELLQDDAINAQPLAVNAGMIRQLSTQDYRININQVTENTAFILADPDLEGFVFQLPGAKQEGDLVNSILTERGFETNNVEGTAGQIIKELFSKSYKIMHLAGHGVFNQDPNKGSGMLIGNNIYLSTREICQMSSVPELVFVNCCYLGKIDGELEALYQDRYKLAANIGTQLIRNGVKAVIVAGWAVDDMAAYDFTEIFYKQLLAGYNFGEAVQNARKIIYDRYKSKNNTWGAYQCYGDPFYKLVQEQSYAVNNEYSFMIAKEAEIELTNLINKLELTGTNDDWHRAQLEGISRAVDKAEIRNGRITELEAVVYNGLRLYSHSVEKYASLINEELAVFSFAAMEQYCSVRIKNAVEIFRNDGKQRKKSIETAHKVIADLEILKSYSATSERLNLLGSSYRRLALLSDKGEEKINAYIKSATYYYEAYSRPNSLYKTHSFCSWVNMENVLVLAGNRKWGAQLKGYKLETIQKIEKELTQLLESLSIQVNVGNYWDLAAIINIKMSLYLLGKGGYTVQDILAAYTKLWASAGARGKKISEIELCDLMIDALTHIEHAKARRLAAELTFLRTELVKLI